jgi:hypothetical protein
VARFVEASPALGLTVVVGVLVAAVAPAFSAWALNPRSVDDRLVRRRSRRRHAGAGLSCGGRRGGVASSTSRTSSERLFIDALAAAGR